MSTKNNHVMAFTNLEYLRNITESYPKSMREIILLFMEQIPELIKNMKMDLNDKNYIQLGKDAHKAKSSVMVMGMDELGQELKGLQLDTVYGTGKEDYVNHVKRFEEQCNRAIEELERELEFLKELN